VELVEAAVSSRAGGRRPPRDGDYNRPPREQNSGFSRPPKERNSDKSSFYDRYNIFTI